MQIKWYGHSCFLLTDNNGTSILTDPCNPSYGYKLPQIAVDVVTVSHNHGDHNYVKLAVEGAKIINTPEEFEVDGVKIQGFETNHDKSYGAIRGKNIMFVYEMDDMRILHCGDLGDIPDEDLIKALGRIDILLVPIGGIYTIDDLEARELANILKPGVVIPMHYKTPKLKFELCSLGPFIDAAKNCHIYKMSECEASITKASLGEDRVIVLRPWDADKDAK